MWIPRGILPLTKHDGWTAPACLTEVLQRFAMLTITGYKHISTFKENHKQIFLPSDAFKVPVAKLTASEGNLLWEVITQVGRSTDLCSRRQFLIFLVNHLNRPTTEQSGPQLHSVAVTHRDVAIHNKPRGQLWSVEERSSDAGWDQRPRAIDSGPSSWSGVSVRAEFAVEPWLIHLLRWLFFQRETPAPGLPNLLHHLDAASLRSHKLASHQLISRLYRHLPCQTRTPLSCF